MQIIIGITNSVFNGIHKHTPHFLSNDEKKITFRLSYIWKLKSDFSKV